MIIVGCDFHPSWQQVAVFDSETGEIARTEAGERRRRGGAVLSLPCRRRR